MKEKIIVNTFTPEVGQNVHFTLHQPFVLAILFYFFFLSVFIFLFKQCSRSSLHFLCKPAPWLKHKEKFLRFLFNLLSRLITVPEDSRS